MIYCEAEVKVTKPDTTITITDDILTTEERRHCTCIAYKAPVSHPSPVGFVVLIYRPFYIYYFRRRSYFFAFTGSTVSTGYSQVVVDKFNEIYGGSTNHGFSG